MACVPNCRKEIVNRYAIRGFKCKLKPPKNGNDETSIVWLVQFTNELIKKSIFPKLHAVTCSEELSSERSDMFNCSSLSLQSIYGTFM